LVSPVFGNQRKSAGRTPFRMKPTQLPPRHYESRRQDPPAWACRHLNLPPLRLPGVIAAMRRLLNFDGVDVLSIDEASDSVVLDVERLKVQFDVQ